MQTWTRREFVRGAAGIVALPRLLDEVPSPQFAYVASGRGSIHVFKLRGEVWARTQCVTSRAPACVVLSPAQRTLYVANEVEVHEGLPRGTVEAFNIDPVDGRLTLLNRRPMSLSATHPRHMAVSPDGRLLAVAAYGGGVYNLFPVAEDGRLGAPSGVFKAVGSGPNAQWQASAHPDTVLFDLTGRRLLSSDFGSDRLSVFAVEDGRLERRMQHSTGEGSGPGACSLHPSGLFFYAWHDLAHTLACYRYDALAGSLGEMIQRISFPAAARRGLALHPSGRMLYTTHGNELRAWHVDAATGKISRAGDVSLGPSRIMAALDGESVFVLDGPGGSIYKVTTDRATGELLRKAKVAVVNKPISLVIKTSTGKATLSG